MENLEIKEEPLNIDEVKLESQETVENNQSLVKDFFVKENVNSTKELASLFGQSEVELQKEFGSYKAKKIYRKLGLFLDVTSLVQEEVIAKLKLLPKYGFYGVTAQPLVVPFIKSALNGSGVVVRALISYPYGLDTYKTLKVAVKQALEKGADELLLTISPYEIKNFDGKDLYKKINKLKKLSRNKMLIIALDGENLTLTQLDGIISHLAEAGVDGVSIKCEGVDKNLIESAVQSANGKVKVELISNICSAEDAVSVMLSGINLLTTTNCEQVATDLNKKINTVGCQSPETLDNNP